MNTDFGETEADDLQTNLTRFSLFQAEKREFFLENSGIFEFGPGAAGAGAKANKQRNETAERLVFSEKFACPVSGFTIPEIEPRLFSFNNPFGACPE